MNVLSSVRSGRWLKRPSRCRGNDNSTQTACTMTHTKEPHHSTLNFPSVSLLTHLYRSPRVCVLSCLSVSVGGTHLGCRNALYTGPNAQHTKHTKSEQYKGDTNKRRKQLYTYMFYNPSLLLPFCVSLLFALVVLDFLFDCDAYVAEKEKKKIQKK